MNFADYAELFFAAEARSSKTEVRSQKSELGLTGWEILVSPKAERESVLSFDISYPFDYFITRIDKRKEAFLVIILCAEGEVGIF
jgi:hypothetical protein